MQHLDLPERRPERDGNSGRLDGGPVRRHDFQQHGILGIQTSRPYHIPGVQNETFMKTGG